MHLPVSLRLSAALLLATLFTPVHASSTHTPQQQVAGVQHMRIGTLQVTALFDGVVALGREEVVGIDPGIVIRMLEHRYVPENAKGLQTAVNAYLVQRGDHLTLVDTGAQRCFGPGLGQVLANLRAAGYAPEQVDDVLITHAHPDHMCGLLDAQGKPAYRNATVWLSRADADHWLDPANEAAAPQPARFVFKQARDAVAPYAASGKLHRFDMGDALPEGVTAEDSHGHTPGHVSWRIDGGEGQQLLVWGDLVHFHAVQFARPDAAFEADSDRTVAIASRKRMMAEAADKGWWVAGAHLPFPGLGHVRREGDAYAWVPAEFMPLPTSP